MKRIQVRKGGMLKLLAPVLTAIFQSSFDVGELPMEWKGALISSIFKKGDICSAANYRPVSLTCVVYKIFEHITHSSVMKQLDKFDIITGKQHRFRRKRSCETQLIATIEDIASKLRTGKDQVDIILLDLAKL